MPNDKDQDREERRIKRGLLMGHIITGIAFAMMWYFGNSISHGLLFGFAVAVLSYKIDVTWVEARLANSYLRRLSRMRGEEPD